MKKTALLSMLLAFALILGYVEALIPLPFGMPGMKLGLPNLAVLLTMYRFGNKEALTVNGARVLLSGFLFGNFSAILYSLSGAVVSFLVMAGCKKFSCFSVTGVSVAGGTAHNCAQLLVAMLVVQTYRTVYYLPYLLAAGCDRPLSGPYSRTGYETASGGQRLIIKSHKTCMQR
ncbi:MAG: Gx transporter family protein [Eisenbergiella sp.]